MLSWFQALMPREERFFDHFESHAETVVLGAKAPRRLLDGGDERLVGDAVRGVLLMANFGAPGSAVVLSALLGFLLALLLALAVSWIFARGAPLAVDTLFRTLQFVSASLYSLGPGGNDAQKTMGVIAVLHYSHGVNDGEFHVPFWVVISCQAAMGLGALFGGWRIVQTMRSKITRLTPVQRFCAETGGAITLFLATGLPAPVSTTHTITGAIVGAARRASAVRWSVAEDIVIAWIITMPMAGLIAADPYAAASPSI